MRRLLIKQMGYRRLMNNFRAPRISDCYIFYCSKKAMELPACAKQTPKRANLPRSYDRRALIYRGKEDAVRWHNCGHI